MEWCPSALLRNINGETQSKRYRSISDQNVDLTRALATEDAIFNMKIQVISMRTSGILERNTNLLGSVNLVGSLSPTKKNDNFMKMSLAIPFSKILFRFYEVRVMLKNLRINAILSSMESKVIRLPWNHHLVSLKHKAEVIAEGKFQTTQVTVHAYFVDYLQVQLRYSRYLVCINVGKPTRPMYILLELCSLVSLRRYTKALSTHSRSSLVEKSRQKPQVLATNKSSENALLRAAGVSISSSFTEIEGRVLFAPKITQRLPLQKEFMELKSQLELKSPDLSLFHSRAEQNEHDKLGEIVKKLELDLTEAKLELKDKQKLHADCVSKMKSLEKTVKEHANNREDRLKELDKKIKTTRAQMQSASKDLKVNSIKNAHHEAESELKYLYRKIKECDSEINSFYEEAQKFQHQTRGSAIEKKNLENEVKRMTDFSTRVDKLIEKNSGIESKKQLFGKTATDYDLSSTNPHKAKDKLEKLPSEQSDLEKRVNTKVIAMFEKAEGEYNELISKKIVIENGNDIRHVKVDSEFGSIFLILLPGTMSKLEPPEGCSFFDGLEVRVAFGSVWKQSLPELSGGQRFLLALSLIVALILFKLAPLYILVEVDAALDLKPHTTLEG